MQREISRRLNARDGQRAERNMGLLMVYSNGRKGKAALHAWAEFPQKEVEG